MWSQSASCSSGSQPPGRSRAPGEHAGQVDQGDLFRQPVAHLVGVDLDVVVQVDHRLHHHFGVRVPAPRAGSARPAIGPRAFSTRPTSFTGEPCWVTPPPGTRCTYSTTCRGFLLPSSASSASRRHRLGSVGVAWAAPVGGVEVEGELAAGQCPRAAMARRTSNESVEPEVLQGFGASTEGGVQVDGVGQVELAVHRGWCPAGRSAACRSRRGARPRPACDGVRLPRA